MQISPEKAKEIMDSEKNVVVLDVRRKEEYALGHIKGALLIPHVDIEEEAENLLPDKEQKILVYCRSGYRSKLVENQLGGMGYTNVYEFGGILEWEYELVV